VVDVEGEFQGVQCAGWGDLVVGVAVEDWQSPGTVETCCVGILRARVGSSAALCWRAGLLACPCRGV
jgi:hypothetical protein